MISRLCTVIVLLIVLTACQPSAPQPTAVGLRSAVVPTRAPTTEPATPTETLTPTEVVPSETPSPSITPTSTESPTLEITATPSITPSIEPIGPGPNAMPIPQGEILVLDEAVSGELEAGNWRDFYQFAGEAEQQITISMEAQTRGLDTYLILLDPSGREIARNDDRNLASEDFDAAINEFILPAAGVYTIVATRFGGELGLGDGGEYEIEVRSDGLRGADDPTLNQPVEYGFEFSDSIDNGSFQYLLTFASTAGDQISLDMQIGDEDLQALVILQMATSEEVFRSFVQPFTDQRDVAVNNLVLPYTGYYTVLVTRFNGVAGSSSGEFEFSLNLDRPADADFQPQRYAIYGDLLSLTLIDGEPYVGVVGGDYTDSGDTLPIQFLLTYFLPTLQEGQEVVSAALDLSDCEIIGDPFEQLGTLRLYLDEYGSWTRDNPPDTDPGRRAEELDRMSDCEAVDISSIIVNAYEEGETSLQFRGLFNRVERNDANDIVLFQPRLVINLR
jgi:hypothetical protein